MGLWERARFVEQVGGVLSQSIGEIVALSSMKTAANKLNSKNDYFTTSECEAYIGHVIGSISFFITEKELKKISGELYQIVRKGKTLQ
ncbi:MAG: hypothetical protein M0018_06655 [Nitrospiraceae bacterium]|nr:hypothetical protein [Nitrospiraceae bacterium]